MKSDIHPTMHTTMVTCACGSSFETLATKESISTEICSACHPFFTGKQKIVDTARRVEKYEEKKKKSAAITKAGNTHISKKAKRAARQVKKQVMTKGAKADAKAALKAAKAALSDD